MMGSAPLAWNDMEANVAVDGVAHAFDLMRSDIVHRNDILGGKFRRRPSWAGEVVPMKSKRNVVGNLGARQFGVIRRVEDQ